MKERGKRERERRFCLEVRILEEGCKNPDSLWLPWGRVFFF